MFLSPALIRSEIYPQLCTVERHENIALDFLDAFRILVLLFFDYVKYFNFASKKYEMLFTVEATT